MNTTAGNGVTDSLVKMAEEAVRNHGAVAAAGTVVAAGLAALARAFSAKKSAEAVVKAKLPDLLAQVRASYSDIIDKLQVQIHELENEREKDRDRIAELEKQLGRYQRKLQVLNASLTGEHSAGGLGGK